MKKLALLLAVILIVSMVPAFCFATEGPDGEPYYMMVFDEDGKYGDIFSNPNVMSYEGFDEEKKCEVLTVAEGGDPYIYISVAGVEDYFDELPDLSVYKFLQIGIRVDTAKGNNMMALYYTTAEDGAVDEAKTSSAKYTATTDVQAVTISFLRSKRWDGELAGLRIDPYSACQEEHQIELYYIAFFKTREDALAFAKKYAEQGNEAFPAIATATPRPTNTPAPATAEPTEAPTAEPTEVATEEPKSSGCGGTVISVGACIVMACGAFLIRKKH